MYYPRESQIGGEITSIKNHESSLPLQKSIKQTPSEIIYTDTCYFPGTEQHTPSSLERSGVTDGSAALLGVLPLP